MNIRLLVDFKEFWTRLSEDISAARDSVFVQTFAFEGDAVGQQLAAALLSCAATDKRVLADSFTRFVLSDRFRYSPAGLCDRTLRREAADTAAMMSELELRGVKLQFTNPCGISARKLLSRNHKKLLLLDDRVAYLGGINFSEHNAAWHDMMLRIDDPAAAAFLREDFLATWRGQNQARQQTAAGIELLTTDGRNNRLIFKRLIDLIDAAERTIFVESPYITFPFYEPLREAARRGVRVTVLTPAQNNWRFFRNYARMEAARSGIDLRLFRGRMSHLKAMLIDDKCLVTGSSNFDYLSYRLHQEAIAILTNPELIADFRARIAGVDLANSRALECTATTAAKQWLELKTRLVDAAVTILT